MNMDRRKAMKSILLGGSAFGSGFAARALAQDDDQPEAQSGQTVPVLSPDGQLYHVLRQQMDAAPAKGPKDPAVREGVPGRKWIMVIDLAKCAGLKKCTEACQAMHFTPPTQEWIKVFTMQDAEATAPYYFPRPCFHCDNPPCTKVCPVDATFKRKDGVVLIDNDRCIGCRFCMAACPYSVRHFNWGEPEVPQGASKRPYSPETSTPARKGTVPSVTSARKWPRRVICPPASRPAPTGRSTTATRTKTPSPTDSVKHFAFPPC